MSANTFCSLNRAIFKSLLGILGLLVVSNLYAYRVDPLIATVEPSGSGSTMRIIITNTDSTALNLELNGLRVTTDAEGNVSRVEELKDLLIFPAQTSIPPGRKQAVQVRYVGNPKIDKGLVYAVRISQLPVSLTKTSGKAGNEVKVGLNFLSHILVESSDMQASVDITDINKTEDGSLVFLAENTGKATALIREAKWTLTDASGKDVDLDINHLDTGSFGALISGAPKRQIKIKSKATQGLSGEIKISTQLK